MQIRPPQDEDEHAQEISRRAEFETWSDAMNCKRAARPGDTLIAEMSLFTILIGLALIGSVFNSGIHRMLAEAGLSSGWGITVGAIGIIGLTAVVTEWFYGMGWDSPKLRVSYFVRLWCSLFAVIAYAFLAHSIFFYTDFNKAIFPMVLGQICIFFHGLCAFVLRREGVILNPLKNTCKLEARIERRRVST